LAGLSILLVIVPLVIDRYDDQILPTRPTGDPWNYLAAGERLNAGHPLYAISPGDRPVALLPPFWSVPLLSPPFIAVLWRPLALFGDAALVLWWLGTVATTSIYVIWLLRRLETPWAILALVILSPPLALGALHGNAMGYLIPLLALRHPAAVALAGAVRLTPALLAPSVGFLATVRFGVLIALVSFLGAGIENHIDWLRSVPSSAPSASSVSGITGLPPIVVLVSCALVALLGWRPAVVAVTLASPATYFYTLGILTLLLIPLDARPDVGAWIRGRMETVNR
jgi:hypothetical protein